MSTIKRRMGRPPIAGEAMEQISIRLTRQELKAVDALAEKLSVSRNEAVREMLDRGRNAIAQDAKLR